MVTLVFGVIRERERLLERGGWQDSGGGKVDLDRQGRKSDEINNWV